MKMTADLSKSKRFMKKFLAFFFFAMSLCTSAWAQPTITFSDAAPCTDESFCVDVSVGDFTDIVSMDFTIQWDPEIMQFDAVQDFNLTELDLGDFDLTMTADGLLGLSWSVDDCGGMAMGETILQDGTVIFRICFTALGAYGATSEISVLDDPAPVVTRENTGCANIGLIDAPGLVSTCVRPFRLFASQETGTSGSLVCVDFSVSGFDDLTSMQFSAEYDLAVLEFSNIVNPGNLPGLGGNIGTPPDLAPGSISVAWTYVNPSDPDGISLPDSTIIFQACFNIIGDCETSSPVSFTDQPTDIEVTNTVVSGFLIDVFTFDGQVTANDCDPTGIQVNADCGPEVELGDSFCVEVTAGDNFQNVTDLSYLMEWNPFILEYTGIQNFFTGLDAGDFNTNNVENGLLQLNFESEPLPPANLNDGDVLYEVCFDVVGLGGNSPFNFVTNGAVGRSNNGPNIGINPADCQVQITQPEGVAINIGSADVEFAQEVCIDVTVANFVLVDSLRFTVAWDPNVLQFENFDNIDWPGLSQLQDIFVNADAGFFTVEWNDGTMLTLDDDHVLFQTCFTAIGDPSDCSLIEVVDIPVNAESTSEGVTLPVAGAAGEICTLFPEGFYLDIGSTSGLWQDTACLTFTVADFDDIEAAQFSIGWNINQLGCPEIVDPAVVPGINFGVGSCAVGVITVQWLNVGGNTLPDSTVLFELCFPLVGPPDGCYNVQINDTPLPAVEIFGGDSGSLISDVGQVCIENRLIVVDTIIQPASCPDAADGSIRLVVEGGNQPIGYSWQTMPMQFDTIARNLRPGPIAVTIYDFSSPALILVDTFEIPVLPGAPEVMLPDTLTFECGGPLTQITGTGSTGAEYSYEWRGLTGGLPSPDNLLITTVNQPGLYELRVTNDDSGCSVRDTIQVLPAEFPAAEAGDNTELNCNVTSLMLDGTGSEQGPNISYDWTPLGGGAIDDGADSLNPTVSTPGVYQLEVTNDDTNCSSTDTVVVADNAVAPTAFAGQDGVVGCTGTVTLDGTGSFGQGMLSFEWFDENNSLLEANSTFETDQVGTYYLEVTDATGCSDRDTVQITQNADVPLIDISIVQPDTQITCVNDTVRLEAMVTNAQNFSINWAVSDGGQIALNTLNSLTPSVIAAGSFELTITNNDNGCTATAGIAVSENTTPPSADAGDEAELTCDSAVVTLGGSGTSQGDNFIYSWALNSVPVPGANADTLDAVEPGVYLLAVQNENNGCIALDEVEVTADTTLPTVTIAPPDTLTCAQASVALAATVEPGGQYDYAWVYLDGFNGLISDDTTTASVLAGEPGLFEVTATNQQTGCSGIATVSVLADTLRPAVDAGPDLQLGCEDDFVTLQGQIPGSNFIFGWSVLGTDGALQPGTQNQLDAQVISPGAFILAATDTLNGCVGRDTVLVNGTGLPLTNAGPNQFLDCNTTEVTLDGSGSAAGPDIVYTWLTPDSTVISNNVTATPITEPGTYRLVVNNTATGCEDFDLVQVAIDTFPPAITFEPVDTLTCAEEQVTLTALPDDEEDAVNYTYSWTPLGSGAIAQGANTPIAVVTQPDTYQLTVTDTLSGCSQAFDLSVASQIIIPEAEANPPTAVINCDQDFVVFDASASSGANDLVYFWQRADGAFTGTEVQYQAQEPGIYILTVRDLVLGCTATDTVEVTLADDFPIVDAGPDLTLTCDETQAVINATVGGVDPFEFEWTILSGSQFVPGTQGLLTPSVAGPGVYRLTVVNPANNCEVIDTVTVTENVTDPIAEAGGNFTLDCIDDSFTLNGAGSSTFENLIYNWYLGPPSGGNLIAGTLQHTVSTPGTYYLEVLDTSNGCFAIDSAIVNELIVEIELAPPAETPAITCADSSQAWVTVNVTPEGEGFDYEWSTADGDPDFEGQGNDSIRVTLAGTYTVTVTDPFSGCFETLDLTVEDNTNEILAATAADTAFLTCISTEVTLNSEGSSAGPDILYQWAFIGAGGDTTLIEPDNPSVQVGMTGEYLLTVIDTLTECDATASVTVLEDTTPPVALVAAADLITCDNPVVSVDATGSEGNNLTFDWSAGLNPTDPGFAEVSAGGTYSVTVTNGDNGCIDSTEFEVVADTLAPIADAGAPVDLTCPGDQGSLDGSGSTQGVDITYAWTASAGGVIVAGASTLTPTVNAAGDYQLVVTDTTNGCTATDQVTVATLEELPDAAAGEDVDNCGDEITLMANLPDGLTGMWENLSSGTLLSPTEGTTLVRNMPGGENVFVWTLSSENCPDYSSDTIRVFAQPAPDLNDDDFFLESGEQELTIDPLGNDLLGNIPEFEFTIVSEPSIGSIEDISADNVLSYFVREGFFGTDIIVYEVCNLVCPDLCERATITIEIEQGDITDVFTPSGITPNNDGMNDTFFFDLLANANEEDFPDNEMLIFNRWGDIVYQAKPYNNDWNGLNDEGQELPQGTYYYILRLNIAEGIILKGDVTIVR